MERIHLPSHEEIRVVYSQGEEAVIALVSSIIANFIGQVEILEKRIQLLESQLSKNSSNSNFFSFQ